MAKGKSVIVRLVSTAGTGTTYTTKKNPKMAHKLNLKKYDKVVKKHVLFEEKKIK